MSATAKTDNRFYSVVKLFYLFASEVLTVLHLILAQILLREHIGILIYFFFCKLYSKFIIQHINKQIIECIPTSSQSTGCASSNIAHGMAANTDSGRIYMTAATIGSFSKK